MMFLLIQLLMGMFVCLPALVAQIEPEGAPVRKIQRGFLNIVLSPFEIAYEVSQGTKTDQFVPTWAVGLGKGACYAAGRALAGAYEIVTAPFPIPSGYEPVVYPEFAWQHFDGEQGDQQAAKSK
ncbi:MAG: exosortase system-associated protein, TIGR04073 family [Candidatus Omnitrophica bacterium]|nr:exosortase system-associated protein, TIGR04073 family [Candidatus Omnitrophota bacterium]